MLHKNPVHPVNAFGTSVSETSTPQEYPSTNPLGIGEKLLPLAFRLTMPPTSISFEGLTFIVQPGTGLLKTTMDSPAQLMLPAVAFMVAEPFESALTRPVESTAALSGTVELHVLPAGQVVKFPLLSMHETENCAFVPSCILN